MAVRSKATLDAAIIARKPSDDQNMTQRDVLDRAELLTAMRIQQRLKFSRQNSAFASTGEVTYY